MAIIEEFEAFDDWEERYKHLIQVGRGLEGIPAELQQDEHKVRGCSSSVWLLAEHNEGTVHFQADSDAVLVRGLVALLMRVYDQRSPRNSRRRTRLHRRTRIKHPPQRQPRKRPRRHGETNKGFCTGF